MNLSVNSNYPDPININREKLIFVRFDKTDPSSFSTPIYFPVDDILKNKIITGIECFKSKAPFLPYPSDPIQTDAGYIGQYFDTTYLKYFTLTLVGKNNEILVNDMPLTCLTPDFDFGKIRRFSMIVDLSKCYVRNFGLSGLTSDAVIPINFYYKNVGE